MMVGFLIRVVVTTLAVLVASYLLAPGGYFGVDDVPTALIFAVVLGLLNAFVRPVLTILTLPLTILTLGLFILVLNVLIFWVAAALVAGVHVGGFLGAVLGALITTVVSAIISHFIH